MIGTIDMAKTKTPAKVPNDTELMQAAIRWWRRHGCPDATKTSRHNS